MFECDCTQRYELNLDGYSCKPNNISYSLSSNESKLDDDDYSSSSDVFYQKGVSFSAKLDDIDNDNHINNVHQQDFTKKNEVDNQR